MSIIVYLGTKITSTSEINTDVYIKIGEAIDKKNNKITRLAFCNENTDKCSDARMIMGIDRILRFNDRKFNKTQNNNDVKTIYSIIGFLIPSRITLAENLLCNIRLQLLDVFKLSKLIRNLN